jgi:hypothetical protein
MPTDRLIEDRLAAVESAVVELQRRLEPVPPAASWLDQFIGMFEDEPAFDEVVALGRELREQDRPGQVDAAS